MTRTADGKEDLQNSYYCTPSTAQGSNLQFSTTIVFTSRPLSLPLSLRRARSRTWGSSPTRMPWDRYGGA